MLAESVFTVNRTQIPETSDNGCSDNIRKVHRKTPAIRSIFIEVVTLASYVFSSEFQKSF